MLKSIFETGITLNNFLLCTLISLALGIGTALISKFKTKCTESFS